MNVAAAGPYNVDAGMKAKELATEGLERPIQGNHRKIPEAKVTTASAELSRRPPKKCKFTETLGCTGTHFPLEVSSS